MVTLQIIHDSQILNIRRLPPPPSSPPHAQFSKVSGVKDFRTEIFQQPISRHGLRYLIKDLILLQYQKEST